MTDQLILKRPKYISSKIFWNNDIPDRAKTLYVILHDLSYKTGYCAACNSTLAGYLKCGVSKINDSLNKLVEQKIIVKKGKGYGRKIYFVEQESLPTMENEEEVQASPNTDSDVESNENHIAVTNPDVRNKFKGKSDQTHNDKSREELQEPLTYEELYG